MNTERPQNNTPHRMYSSRSKTCRLTPQFSSGGIVKNKKTIKTTVGTPPPKQQQQPASLLCHQQRPQFRTETKSKRNHSFLESSSPTAFSLAEHGDRFIPHRRVAGRSAWASATGSSGQYEFDGFKVNARKHQNIESLQKEERDRFLYQSLIAQDYHERIIQPKALFAFSGKRRAHEETTTSSSNPFAHDTIRPFPLINEGYSDDDDVLLLHQDKKPRRQQDIPKTAFKILDVPGLRDDFYLHLLSWSKADVLAVALADIVYLVRGHGKSIIQVLSLREMMSDRSHRRTTNVAPYVTCVSWNEIEPRYLAIASSDGMVYVFDTLHTQQHIASLKVPPLEQNQATSDIVTVVAWNGSTLCAGGKRGIVYFWDLQSSQHVCFKALRPHQGTVCSLAWHSDRTQFATGGNDNLAMVHDIRNPRYPRLVLHGHDAAVKALSWCPFQRDTLVTGGGSKDQTIKIWKTSSTTTAGGPRLHKSIDTGDQVCSIEWNPVHQELISASGYRKSELVVWQFPQMKRITELKYHTKRILYTAMSPDHSTIVTGGGDELLALWQVNPTTRSGGRTALGHMSPLLPEALNRPIR